MIIIRNTYIIITNILVINSIILCTPAKRPNDTNPNDKTSHNKIRTNNEMDKMPNGTKLLKL